MPAVLASIIVWALGSAVARVFVALGISLFTYSALETLVQSALDQLSQVLGELPSAVVQLSALAGVDQAM